MLQRTLIAGLVMAAFAAPAASAQSGLNETERDEVREIVRDYILENPSIIEEALILLQAQIQAEEAAELASLQSNIPAEADALLRDPRDFAIGPEDAPVQIVEFFDYNCGFCRRSTEWVREVIETHGDNVRVVFKESPIFMTSNPGSGFAARAALASIQQDRYLDFHFALMEHEGGISEPVVRDIARSLNINMRWLQNVMDEEAIALQLDETLELGERVGMRGTPYFIINGTPVGGFNVPLLDALLAEGLAQADVEPG